MADKNSVRHSCETANLAALGGNLDITISKNIDLPAFQLDYNLISINGRKTDSTRFSVGSFLRDWESRRNFSNGLKVITG